MKSLHKIFTHCLIFLACTLSVQISIAQSIPQPTAPKASRATAQKLINVMNSQKMIEEIFDNSMKLVGDEASRLTLLSLNIQHLTPEDEKILANLKKDISQIIKKEYPSQKLINQMLDSYTTHFTEQELQDAIAFYQTPSGQSILFKLPDLMNQVIINNIKDLEQPFEKKLTPVILDAAQKLAKNHPTE